METDALPLEEGDDYCGTSFSTDNGGGMFGMGGGGGGDRNLCCDEEDGDSFGDCDDIDTP
jgi:hypothetical protein